MLNGVINIFKPPGMTSFDVIAHLRKLTNQKRIGHSGTLDPEACGVLPTYFGNACGAIEFEQEETKGYTAEILFGLQTDSEDITGNVVDICSTEVDMSRLAQILEDFRGEQLQVPPMYSAVKINGKKLYELARKGVEVERKARSVEIFDIRYLKSSKCEHLVNGENKRFLTTTLYIHCSKGTYIRTLCKDISIALGTIGTMSFLLRNSSGSFSLNDSFTLEELETKAKVGKIEECVKPTVELFKNFNEIKLDSSSEKKYMNGMAIKSDLESFVDSHIKVFNIDGQFVSLGQLEKRDDGVYLKSKKFFL